MTEQAPSGSITGPALGSQEILFLQPGGLGKAIAGTAVARQIRAKFPSVKLHVQTGYPDIYQGLEFVDRVWPLAPQAHFFEDVASKCEIFEAEPYKDFSFRKGREHLIDVWCRLLRLDLPKEKRGSIVLSAAEKRNAKTQLTDRVGRPIIAFQFRGGTSSHDAGSAANPERLFQARHLSVDRAQAVVDDLVKEGFAVLQISLPTEPKLKNALYLSDQSVIPTRHMLAFLNECSGLVAIDSFASHAWAALGKTGAVCLWGYSSPIQYGYAGNTHLAIKDACKTPHCNRPETHLFDVLPGTGQSWQCPHDGACMSFSPKEIVQAVLAQVRPEKKL